MARPEIERGDVVLDRFGRPALLLVERAQGMVRLRALRIERQRFAEAGFRRGRRAGARRELSDHDQGADAGDAAMRRVEHRVGKRDRRLSALLEMEPRSFGVATRAIRHPEAVVHRARRGLERERGVETLDRAVVVADRERGATEPVERLRRARLDLESAREDGSRLLGSRAVEQDVAEPQQRGDVVGAQRERGAERRGCAFELAFALQQHTEQVRPARLRRVARGRFAQARLGVASEVVEQVELAQRSVSSGEVARRGLAIGRQTIDRRARVEELALDGWLEATGRGRRQRAFGGGNQRQSRYPRRCGARDARRKPARGHGFRPVPWRSVV